MRTKPHWVANGKNITTKAGTFVGYAASKDDALTMAAAQALLALLEELQETNPDLKSRLDRILSDCVE